MQVVGVWAGLAVVVLHVLSAHLRVVAGGHPGPGTAGPVEGGGVPDEGRTGSAFSPTLGPWEITQLDRRVRLHDERGIGAFTAAKV